VSASARGLGGVLRAAAGGAAGSRRAAGALFFRLSRAHLHGRQGQGDLLADLGGVQFDLQRGDPRLQGGHLGRRPRLGPTAGRPRFQAVQAGLQHLGAELIKALFAEP
jgi:hypothetical protein